jgi:hypothetical protein
MARQARSVGDDIPSRVWIPSPPSTAIEDDLRHASRAFTKRAGVARWFAMVEYQTSCRNVMERRVTSETTRRRALSKSKKRPGWTACGGYPGISGSQTSAISAISFRIWATKRLCSVENAPPTAT